MILTVVLISTPLASAHVNSKGSSKAVLCDSLVFFRKDGLKGSLIVPWVQGIALFIAKEKL
ncbi:MAG: hypothetical protein H6Q69_3165 [Firmicutes bacterium]|nr:hypothetical protein [Bacillota bacterium]